MAFSIVKFCSRLSNSVAVPIRCALSTSVTNDQVPILTGLQKLQFNRTFHETSCCIKLKTQMSVTRRQLYSTHASRPTSSREKHEVEFDSDSESDFDSSDTTAKRGETEFWRRKMRTFHGILDINKDGVISFEDFKLLADKFVNLGHLSLRHEDEFYSIIKNMWEERWGSIDPYNLVTTQQFLDDMHHVLNDKSLRKKLHHFLPYLFKAVDYDKNGIVSIDEYKLFFQCLNLPSEAAVVSFYVIDENNDGHLSMKEFVKLGRDFFICEDIRKPSKMFWGPLLD